SISTSGAASTEYQFQNEPWNAAIGAYRLGSAGRDLSAVNGRFITQDSITPAPGDTLNSDQYIFGAGNPNSNSDPTGMFTGFDTTAAMDMGRILDIGGSGF